MTWRSRGPWTCAAYRFRGVVEEAVGQGDQVGVVRGAGPFAELSTMGGEPASERESTPDGGETAVEVEEPRNGNNGRRRSSRRRLVRRLIGTNRNHRAAPTGWGDSRDSGLGPGTRKGGHPKGAGRCSWLASPQAPEIVFSFQFSPATGTEPAASLVPGAQGRRRGYLAHAAQGSAWRPGSVKWEGSTRSVIAMDSLGEMAIAFRLFAGLGGRMVPASQPG